MKPIELTEEEQLMVMAFRQAKKDKEDAEAFIALTQAVLASVINQPEPPELPV